MPKKKKLVIASLISKDNMYVCPRFKSFCLTTTKVGKDAYLHVWFRVAKARGDKFEIITVIRLQKKNHSGYTMIVRRKKKPNEAGLDFQGYHGLIYQLAAMFYYFITYTTIVRLPSHVVVFRLSEKCLTEMYQSHEY